MGVGTPANILEAVDRGVDRGMDSRKTFPVYKDSCLHLKTDRAII